MCYSQICVFGIHCNFVFTILAIKLILWIDVMESYLMQRFNSYLTCYLFLKNNILIQVNTSLRSKLWDHKKRYLLEMREVLYYGQHSHVSNLFQKDIILTKRNIFLHHCNVHDLIRNSLRYNLDLKKYYYFLL